MKITGDRLAQRLKASLARCRSPVENALLAAHDVDGYHTGADLYACNREQLAAALRICCRSKATITPWGGGTAMAFGNPPRHLDVVIEFARLNSSDRT